MEREQILEWWNSLSGEQKRKYMLEHNLSGDPDDLKLGVVVAIFDSL